MLLRFACIAVSFLAMGSVGSAFWRVPVHFVYGEIPGTQYRWSLRRMEMQWDPILEENVEVLVEKLRGEDYFYQGWTGPGPDEGFGTWKSFGDDWNDPSGHSTDSMYIVIFMKNPGGGWMYAGEESAVWIP